MILSNITSSASTATTLLSLTVSTVPDPKSSVGYYTTQSRSGTSAPPVPYPSSEPQEILALPLLVDAFIQGTVVDDENDPEKRPRKANLHFLASVFANVSIVRPFVGFGRDEHRPVTRLDSSGKNVFPYTATNEPSQS